MDKVFDEAVKLILDQKSDKGVEVEFDSFQERENFRTRLYRQKQVLTKNHPNIATCLGIKAVTDRKKGSFKVVLYYLKPLSFKVVTIED